MRNIFDQYSQPENRVTHALVTALHEDPKLLGSFLADIAGCSPRVKGPIEISEQTYPGKIETTEDETERRGIPDVWITAGDEWCLVIENKVLMAATPDQLTRHLAMARRLGYSDPKALVLTVRDTDGKMPEGTRVVEWRTVYRWLNNQAAKSPWARRVAEYLEILEGQMVDQEQLTAGTLTAFNGFPFNSDNPFSYLEAKRILNLATDELRDRDDLRLELGMAPDLLGRSAITGRGGDSIWDYLQIEAARDAGSFAEFPHLTIGISQTNVEAMVTIPNQMPRKFLRHLVKSGPDGFRHLVLEVLKRMQPILAKCKGMEPRMIAVQRRFPSQRSVPFRDAVIDFDLRTGFDEVGPPKTQRQWIDAVYGCLAEQKSNFRTQIGARFPYRTCKAIGTVDALDYMAEAWIACRPLIEELVMDRISRPL